MFLPKLPNGTSCKRYFYGFNGTTDNDEQIRDIWWEVGTGGVRVTPNSSLYNTIFFFF